MKQNLRISSLGLGCANYDVLGVGIHSDICIEKINLAAGISELRLSKYVPNQNK